MTEFPNARPWAALAAVVLLASTVVGCTANNKSATGGYYVVNPDDQVYTDGNGHCWHVTDQDKTESDYREECGDQVAQAGPKDSDGDGVIDANDQCPGTPAGTEVDARGCPIEKTAPIVLRGVTFEFDKSRLTPQARNRLDNVVDALEASPDVSFRIDGYTDSIGTEQYNQGLSQRRVDSVREYLINHNIGSTRITATVGHGESNPVATNETAAGRAQNRRVELHVTNQSDSMGDDDMMEQ